MSGHLNLFNAALRGPWIATSPPTRLSNVADYGEGFVQIKNIQYICLNRVHKSGRSGESLCGGREPSHDIDSEAG
jgi:hypothetical protein